MRGNKIEAIVIGASAGGVENLNRLFSKLEKAPAVPIMVALHIAPHGSIILDAFARPTAPFQIKEAEDKEELRPGHIYFAPPNYHLLVEEDKSLSLSVEEPVQYSRPSIDVLFNSAGIVFDETLCGILLTGSNSDGAEGLLEIKERGGHTIVQDLTEAPFSEMPSSAIELCSDHEVLVIDRIAQYINNIEAFEVGNAT